VRRALLHIVLDEACPSEVKCARAFADNSVTMWMMWKGWLFPATEGGLGLGGWSHDIVFVVLFCALVDFVKLLIELLGRDRQRNFRSDPSVVSAVIACRNGVVELPNTIEELSKQLPPDRILVVDDGSGDETAELARRMGCTVFRFENSKGKAAAIHYAIHRVKTPLTLLLDDDTRLGGARIPTSLITDDGFDAVAFYVLPDRRNRGGARGNTFVGHLQRYEYAKSMEIGKRFHDVTQSVSCVSGAVGLFRTETLNRYHHQHSGVFQGEDLQRTIIHLLNRHQIVFADEPVWTVAPATMGQWFRQRLFGWYPGLYHQLPNLFRLMFSRGAPWRLRYEMAYNIYTVLSDPLKTWSMVMLLITPGLRWWAGALYMTYLSFELYPYLVIRMPGGRHRAPIGVLLLYPLYGAVNTVLRTLALPVWFWFRFVTGSMRPRTGPKDRMP
jgi:cellulose synthase/poly-beta-1,6-N-acetylglucosamine synthase-like glycosyltransferase